MPSSNYTGLPYPAPGNDAPSPAPSPGSQLVIIVPADDTPNTAANLYIQQYKTVADYVNAIQSAARPSAPVAPGTAVGFSAVTQVGGGTGTVTPSGTAYGGQNVVIKMIAGGAVGVATYQYSLDGGSTYSGTATTSASVTLGSSGISVAFAGTFSASTTYQFKCAFAPAARFTDSSGNGRFLVDHNGFDGGLISVNEHWRGADSGTASPLVATPWHKFVRTGTTINYSVGVNSAQNPTMSALTLSPNANANGDYGYVGSPGGGYETDGSALVSRFRMDIAPLVVGANNLDIWAGWSTDNPMHLTTTNKIAFNLTSGVSSPWNMVACNGAATTTTSTGVVAVATNWTRLQIEIHGSATPIGTAAGGNVALFFINDVYVGSVTTNLPTFSNAYMGPYFGFKTLSSTAGGAVVFGSYSYRIARIATVF